MQGLHVWRWANRTRTGVAALVVAAGLLAGGCSAPDPRPHPEAMASLVSVPPSTAADMRFRPLGDDEKRNLPALPAPGPYLVGKGDVLNVQGLGDTFKGVGETRKGDIVGVKVKTDGRLYLPYLPPVQAEGKTVLQIQDALREELRRFEKEPFVSVDVLEFRSQRYFVLGEVGAPGLAPVDGEITLLEAVAKAGGLTKAADVDMACLIRDRKVVPVCLADIVRHGDLAQNIVLQDRDLVLVPSLKQRRVYVFGEVAGPGAFPMDPDGMTLADAVALAGGLDALEADVNQVRIYRGSWSAPQVFTVSSQEAYQHGTSVQLLPGDRIYVAPKREVSYARALQLMSPLLTTPMSLATTALAVEATIK